ncbi:hypothetical protein C7C46_00165 [Streptomyces tateyamensis]|uniref:Spore-associated protein A n=1 Tax=Streptomyces tateyamensis TaxID=565073 RepID=A0A2V4NWR4_9ACTN|nr:hypothetical protein [Streptomyces tateyamensis]PYC88531.1 hypothetical protein C7C46_00165 [Streptomyces tateyamensis]
MREILRRAALGATLIAATAGGLTFAAGPASAAGWGCSGSEVSGSPYAVTTDSGTVYSYAHLFYDSSTGMNCAVNVKAGSLYGVASYTGVTLYECAQDTPGTCTGIEVAPDDSTTFKYYAGPVSVPGRGHCVQLWAETDNAARTSYATYDSYQGFHC